MLYNRALSQDEIQAIINVRDAFPPLVGSVLVNNGADNTTSDTLTLNLTSWDASPIVAYQLTDNGSFTGLPWISDNLTPSDNINFTTNFTLSSPRCMANAKSSCASKTRQAISPKPSRITSSDSILPHPNSSAFHCWER